ncbi:hypothetical protein JVU11DRAFT_3195 [Chiua virens]|nr:hypothetical protein JVU11DRAFT_3195 [Chiua virens]
MNPTCLVTTEHTSHYLLKYLKPLMTRVLIFPWLPQRLYVKVPGCQEIWHAMSPTHQNIMWDIILVPSEEAGHIFTARPTLPCPSWVQIQKGKYRRDIGYILNVHNDTIDILVVPCNRPYDLLEEKTQRRCALFDCHTAHNTQLDLTAIANTRNIITFRCNDANYFVGLLYLLLKIDDLERIIIPSPEEILMFGESGIDMPFVHQTCTLFSSQFWKEGDVVHSLFPELLSQKARVVTVNVESQLISLHLNNQLYHYSLLEQQHVFSVGERV